MTGEQAVIDREIFQRAVQLPAHERSAYLDQACGDNVELRQEVESLLVAHDTANGFMEQPAFQFSAAADDLTSGYQSLAEGPGTVIGPYKLLQQIGEGGMGVVFMAEQSEPIQRTVALKIIKPGMDTRQVIARFEAERQALAMMDHPNIAKVLDAGTTDTGRPYFVMDLVKGVPITKYCDEKHQPLRERLELYMQVCRAVQHAHQKGIIHRDLKPSNVLVALYDGHPVPKIIDFGVAKATGPKLTERTLFTDFGAVIGTLEYMSPEQAELNQLDVDTRSDIYGLGVLLYELLTGTTPLERKRVKDSSLIEMLRVIREEEPPKPSTRLSTIETSHLITDDLGLESAQLSGLVRGELDWIVMKALEKNRNRRYETANSMALDLERYLADEPVEACPPSTTYRFRKFAMRNKVAFVTAAIVAVSLVLGTVVSIWQATLARRAEALAQARLESEQEAHQQATAEAIKATTISTLLQQMLASANPSAAKGTDYTVRQMLDDFSADLGDQLRNQPEAEAAIRATIGNAYRGLQSFDKAEPHLNSALELRVRLFGPEHADVAQSLIDYSANDYGRGDVAAAEKRAREALAIHRKLNLQDGTAMRVLSALQLYLVLQAKYEEAEQIAQEALGIARHHPDRYPEVATVLHNLAHAAVYQGDPVKAERFARQSVALHQRLHGEIHPETAHGLYVLATSLHDQQEFDEAEVHYRAALMIHRKQFNDSQTPVLAASAGLAHTLRAKGDQAGLDALRAMIDLSTSQPEEWESWYFRGSFFAELGDWEQADAAFVKAAELDSDPKQLIYLYYLALLRLARHDRAGYRELCSSLVNRAEQSEEPSAAFTAASACVLAPDSACDLSQVVTLAQRAYESNLKKPDYLATLGAALYRAGRFDEAKKRFAEAIEATPSGSSDLYAVTYSHLFLAMALRRLGRPEEARQWLNQAVQTIDKTAPLGEQKVVEGWDSILPLEILRQEAEKVLAESHTQSDVEDPRTKN